AVGHAADSVFVAQLAQDDSQLLMTSAAALDSTTHAGAAHALLAALDRITRKRSQTSRDARVALLIRLRQLGNARLVERVRPYLRDFDPEVAARAADAIEAWSGRRPEPQPSDPPALTPVRFAEAAALARTRAIIEFENGGQIELELFPFDAPTNTARFARLARARYFDGLTLHRNAPNFVVQGGSPNANEYAGDAPFTRDELGLENWRATVGLSTRGRDTGDAQIFINLIDNVRLDHDYTVFARVVRGMEIVDGLLEGAVMRRVLLEQ
ncbi:MAG TPA: peptidylprolyl isomerase, partial [Longimicrobiales bacterium]|nr:peptidylprolyl isomerase [Longimicrobiales bacterium]